jgi:hypothetical protein
MRVRTSPPRGTAKIFTLAALRSGEATRDASEPAVRRVSSKEEAAPGVGDGDGVGAPAGALAGASRRGRERGEPRRRETFSRRVSTPSSGETSTLPTSEWLGTPSLARCALAAETYTFTRTKRSGGGFSGARAGSSPPSSLLARAARKLSALGHG